ncbi:glycoside hydrolase family 2 [Bacillus infantis]|uniref:glycoside hydrolase family 2 protein n=1 Tax=Bacillus infantis TaxID=324767 RepID=UPI001CD2F296|nr:glycoside hydrolase family 2 TIM barrel-domain containing protein [Bacillus infantis]MCA1036607.1 glycoside hydrolase family 2 [Bacillus infantis]
MAAIEKIIGNLKANFQLMNINDREIPFQNGIPYPSFEPQTTRLVETLSGIWKKKRFEADHDWSLSERNEQWILRTEEEASGITKVNFDSSTWEDHSVPLPENQLTGKAEVNGAETYENGVWYRRKFFLDREWENKTITLKCLGLSYVGDFWINGTYAGFHEGGYTPFAFDITQLAQPGYNWIVVRIDNPPWTTRIDTVPAVNNDFFNYTGIIHDLYLEATSGVQVVRTDVVAKSVDGKVDVTVVLENRLDYERKVSIGGTVYETDPQSENWLAEPSAKSIITQRADVVGTMDQTIELGPKETRVVTFQLEIQSPKLWSIRAPHLYVLETKLFSEQEELDSFYSQFGIRTLGAQNAKVLLNDTPVFLAGVARHEEWPGYGRTAAWDRIRSDFLQIADLSVNMVRTAHYPNHVYTFIMLDRIGLTAMSEIPLWQFETHHYEAQEERGISYQMWREMVFSNYNRPSIIMWSTQNESKDVNLRKQYNERLVNEVRGSYNDGRLITQSAAADQPGFDDESMEPLDVAGWTMYFGVFHGSTPYEGTREFIENAHQKWPDKPIINTEYGIWSNADESFLEKQVEIYTDVHLSLIEKVTVSPQGFVNEEGYVAGIDYWTAFDWYVNHNQFYQTMGMYCMDRTTRKPLYHEFIKDHQRLMAATNGLAEGPAPDETKEILHATLEKNLGELVFSFDNNLDMSTYNYLSIEVVDKEYSDGVTVTVSNSKGDTESYETYRIQPGSEYKLYVPLWKLNKSIVSDAASIKVSYEPTRTIEIRELACTISGI